MNKSDIVLIPFPFSDLTGNKLRPAIILISTNLDVTVCFITTQFQLHSGFDITINPSKQNGLKKASLLKTSKLATVDKNLILGRIGKLEEKYLKLLNQKLKVMLKLI